MAANKFLNEAILVFKASPLSKKGAVTEVVAVKEKNVLILKQKNPKSDFFKKIILQQMLK